MCLKFKRKILHLCCAKPLLLVCEEGLGIIVEEGSLTEEGERTDID
jgi:hypothetical protein